MICSTLFILVGVLSILLAGRFSHYALWILCGLGFSWLGDFFLHVSSKMLYFLLGLFSFLTAHIFYVVPFAPRYKKHSQRLVFLILMNAFVLRRL